jgi:two-component system chemotaxis sensor kinase CheA
MPRNKKLSRQITRYLGAETAEEDIAQLSELLRSKQDKFEVPKAISALENFTAFLDIVEAAYQKYEENLEVAERNVSISSEELVQANRSINSMVNSLGQGFLMFDEDGICDPIYSKACEVLLETIPAARRIADVLRLNSDQSGQFKSLIKLAFSGGHAMSFGEIMRLAPQVYCHSQGAHIELVYKPDTDAEGKLEKIVVVASDITEQIRAQELAEQRKALFESIERSLRDRRGFGIFIRHISELTNMLAVAQCGWPWETLRREIHTLKGGAGMFRLMPLAGTLHDLENATVSFVDPEVNAEGRRVLHEQAGMLKAELAAIAGRLKDLLGIEICDLEGEATFDKKAILGFADYLAAQGLVDARREYISRVCAEPLMPYMSRFDLVLSDLAARLNKKILPIIFTGEDIPIVANVYRDLFESFVHLFRNIADHGIETPEHRKELGKDMSGHVDVAVALQEKDRETWLVFDISDDGAGVDVERVRRKLMVRDPGGNWAACDTKTIVNSLLTKDISTCDAVSLYSGRGIGLGAVYAEVKKLSGDMSLSTVVGKGTCFHIEIPYRLAI